MKKIIIYTLTFLFIIGTVFIPASNIFAASTNGTQLQFDSTQQRVSYVTFKDRDGAPDQYLALIYSKKGEVTQVFTTDANKSTYKEVTGTPPYNQIVGAKSDQQALGAVDYGTKLKNNPPPIAPGECVIINAARLPVGFNFDVCATQLFNLVFLRLASYFLWVAGWFFNATLGYSLNMGSFLATVPIVDIGWKIFRDVANICFIFILLYVAINTILQTKSADTKRLLMRVIIVAVLLNFSLFFAKVVIDASNILALQFYEKMGGAESVDTLNPFAKSSNTDGSKGISQTFLKGLGLESIYQSGASQEATPGFGNILAVSVGGAVLIIVTAFVLIAAAIMFIVRTVVLIFVLVLAPLAFLAMILPQTEQYWKKWLGALMNQSFFAPLYMMLMYLVVAMISGGYGAKTGTEGTNLGAFLSGNSSSVGTLYVFIILISLMMGSLIIAKSLGAYGGDFARNMAGKATFGAAGWIGRQTAGRIAQGYVNSDQGQRDKDGNILQRARYKFNSAQAKGTFDFRNSGIGKGMAGAAGGMGTAGGEGGFQKTYDDVKKRKADYAKTIAQQGKKTALETAIRGGKADEISKALSEFTDTEYKELGNAILSNPLVVSNSKPSQIKAVLDEKNEKLSQGQKDAISKTRYKALNDAIEAKDSDKVKNALNELGTNEIATLPNDKLTNPLVFRHFNKDVRAAINKRDDISPALKKQMNDARDSVIGDELKKAAPDKNLIKDTMKSLSGNDILKVHENTTGVTVLTNPDVIDNLSISQLRELADSGLDAPTRKIIGDHIRASRSHSAKHELKDGISAVPATGTAPAVAAKLPGNLYNAFS